MTETSLINTEKTDTSIRKRDLPVEFEMLSKYQRCHLIVSGVGLAVAICAFFAVAFQVHNLAEQTKRQTDAIDLQREAVKAQTASLSAQLVATEAQVWQTIAAQQLELSKVMISNPELRPYFSQGKLIARTDKNFNRVMAIAEMYLDFFDSFDDKYVRSLYGMEDNGKYWLLWERYFHDSFATSPALCLRFSELADWYTKSVGQYARAGCVKPLGKASNPTVHTDAAR